MEKRVQSLYNDNHFNFLRVQRLVGYDLPFHSDVQWRRVYMHIVDQLLSWKRWSRHPDVEEEAILAVIQSPIFKVGLYMRRGMRRALGALLSHPRTKPSTTNYIIDRAVRDDRRDIIQLL